MGYGQSIWLNESKGSSFTTPKVKIPNETEPVNFNATSLGKYGLGREHTEYSATSGKLNLLFVPKNIYPSDYRGGITCAHDVGNSSGNTFISTITGETHRHSTVQFGKQVPLYYSCNLWDIAIQCFVSPLYFTVHILYLYCSACGLTICIDFIFFL